MVVKKVYEYGILSSLLISNVEITYLELIDKLEDNSEITVTYRNSNSSLLKAVNIVLTVVNSEGDINDPDFGTSYNKKKPKLICSFIYKKNEFNLEGFLSEYNSLCDYIIKAKLIGSSEESLLEIESLFNKIDDFDYFSRFWFLLYIAAIPFFLYYYFFIK